MQDLDPIPVQYVGVGIIDGETNYIASDKDTGYPYWTKFFSSAAKVTLPETINNEFRYLRNRGNAKRLRIMAVHTTLELHEMIGPNREQMEAKVAELEEKIAKCSSDIAKYVASGDWDLVSNAGSTMAEYMKERSDALAELRDM